MCDGDNYDFFGTGLIAAGDYSHHLQNINGCDSVVMLSLTVFSNFATTVDTTITQGNSYTLPSGNVVSTAGVYNDTLRTINNCDSIITTNLDVVSGVEEFRMENSEFRIYPNPANEILNIEVDKNLLGSILTVYDVTGKKVTAVQLLNRNTPLEIATLASGVYIAEVKLKEVSVRKRWVKM